jgi:hypothetical protein
MQKQRKNEQTTDDADTMGTVLIVDISGYTSFVHEADYLLGSRTITSLLRVLMDANELGLRVCEIEGDAILFYLPGPPPLPSLLKQQFEAMIDGFWDVTKQLSESVQQASQLSIKMVAHYGRIIEFSLMGFDKLYGEAVIEAHRLLKNKVDSSTYILITERLLSFHPTDACQDPNVMLMCETYDFGAICYRYLQYSRPSRMKGSMAAKSTKLKVLQHAPIELLLVASHR